MVSWSPRPTITVTAQMLYLILRWTAVTVEELSTVKDISYRNISQNTVELGYNIMKGTEYFVSL
jgi:hypothetical protein